ncbi:MAG: tripartite tricarboxylate transporter substrate binding protein [Alphaproteobacteria bacterium]|nr:tripartite tricarboxylate transporter substrate binding protein [Alphaproteobacteria bacterium]
MIRLFALLALAIVGLGSLAQAQTFPSKPIRLVVPFAPGGGTDNLVRLLAADASASLGQQITIDNKPGGATVGGTDMVAKAPADGYTILASDSAFLTNPGLMKNLPYQTTRDFTGITMMARAPVILIVHPSVPAHSVGDLIALAKAKPGTINYASGGNGSSTHLAGELLKQVAGVNIVHVPYRGSGPAMNDLIAGQVQMSFSGISSARQYIDGGQLRVLALTGDSRNPALPNVPTFREAGLAGVNAESYWGLYAPAATPPAVVKTLNQHFTRALKNPQLAQRLAELGYEPIANTPEEHTAQMKQMIGDWTAIIEKAGIRVE